MMEWLLFQDYGYDMFFKLLIAVGLNLCRLNDWLNGVPLATTCYSHFMTIKFHFDEETGDALYQFSKC